MLIHNAVLTGSISLNGSDVSNITGSAAYSASFSSRITNNEATGSTLTAASSSFSTRVTNNEATGSTLTSASSSFSTRTTNIEATGSTLTSASSSFSTRTTTLEAASASFSTRVTSLTVQTGSYATTGSNSFKSDQIITGSIALTGNITASNALYSGNITAQTLIVQTVTSSVLFSTGSNKIGSSLANVQELTGSVGITGSLSVVTTGTEFQVSAGGVNIGNALTDNHVISGSVVINPNGLFVSSSGNVGIGTTTPSQKLHISDSTAVYCRIISTGGGDVYLGSETNIGVLSVSNAMALDIRTNNTTRLYITSAGAIGIGATAITDAYTATGGGWQTIQFGKGGILGAYRTDNESMTGFNTYVTTDGSNKAIISGVGGSAIRYYSELIIFNTLSSSGTAQTQTERMRINSSGNVGVGVTPSAWSSFTAIQLGGNTYSAVASSNHYLNIAANSYYDGTNFRYISTGFTSRYQLSDGTHLWYVAGSGTAGNVVSYTNVMTITSGGQIELNNPVLIGKNTNAGSCIGFTENQIYRTGNGVLYLQEYSTNHIVALNGGGNLLLGTSTNLGYKLFANGSAAGLSNWNNVSDGRLKKDVTPVINGLDKIKQLDGVYFNWDKEKRTGLNLDDKNHIGLIAQDVEEILPQVVTTGDDEFGTKTIAYSDIVPVLIEAIKELSAKNTALEEILQRNNIQ